MKADKIYRYPFEQFGVLSYLSLPRKVMVRVRFRVRAMRAIRVRVRVIVRAIRAYL